MPRHGGSCGGAESWRCGATTCRGLTRHSTGYWIAFSDETVGPYWDPERQHVREGYQDLPFPFTELPFPASAMERQILLADMAGYLDTWSSVRRYRQKLGRDPVAPFVAELASVWGDAGRPRTLRWPLTGRVGKTQASAPARTPT